MAGPLLRWGLPVALILAAGAGGAWVLSSRSPLDDLGGGGTGGAPPPPPPPPVERPRPFAVLVGGEVAGRFWTPPCSAPAQGGLARLGTVVRRMRDFSGMAIVIDTGDLPAAPGEAGATEMAAGLLVLSQSGLAVQAVGEKDLLVGLDRWRKVRSEVDPQIAFLCANLVDELGRPLVGAVARLLAGNKRVHVAAILSPAFEPELRAAGVPVRLLPPVTAVRDALRAAGECDYVILVSHATPSETRGWMKEIPEADLVIAAHGDGIPSPEPEIVDGRTLVVPGPGWQFVGGAALRDPGPGRKPELLDYRLGAVSRQAMESGSDAFALEVARGTLLQPGFLARSLREAADREPAAAYAGPGACASCHPAAHATWKEDPHARAVETLRKRDMHATASCLACHATAPGRKGGFLEAGDAQSAVTCEACHGPGAAHVAAEGRAPLDPARLSCARCHTPEMSPGFRFEEAWPKVTHGR